MNNKKVLQLTHEPKSRRLLSAALESLGYLTKTAPDTKTALQALSLGDCDLVIRDHNGEDILALDMKKRLRSNQA